jgi:hypothetical protein
MTSKTTLALGSAVIAAALVTTVAGLDAYGRSRRVVGPARALDAPGVPVVAVETADEAYRLWRSRHLHGRIVLSLSSRLDFVRPDDPKPEWDPAARRPVDPAVALERAAPAGGALALALERGVAREIRHVVPDRVFAAKAAGAAGEEGVTVAADRISAPEAGSPRTITTLAALRAPDEPALLLVSASFFRERGAREVWRRLAAAGVRTDLVVLSAAREDPEVSEAERGELAALAALLGASP